MTFRTKSEHFPLLWMQSRASSAALAVAILLSGCAAQKEIINEIVLPELTPTSTRTDVLSALGRPTTVEPHRDGTKTLKYIRRCDAKATTEPCASAPAGSPWQHCDFNFSKADLWIGTACTWASRG